MNEYSKLALKEMTKTPREVQVEAIEAMETKDKGLLVLACGTGKTYIQIHQFVKGILQAEAEHRQFKGLWVCHRLMLENQVKNNFNLETDNFFERHNVKLLALNSEGDNSFKNMAKKQMRTAFANQHMIYFTTTKSINDYVKESNNNTTKFAQNVLANIDMYIHDEAHKEFDDNMVQTVCAGMNSNNRKCYFFTATPGEYLAKSTYMSQLYECNFAKSCKAGYIVKPKFYSLKAPSNVNYDDNDFANVIIRAVKHTRKSRKENVNMIVFLPSVDSVAVTGKLLNAVKSNLKRKAIRNTSIYEIISDKVIDKDYLAGLRVNGKEYNNSDRKYTKKEILDIIRQDKGEKIILNAFMLTEGIDLPNLNSVLIACQKSDASLYQAVSRGCRKVEGKNDFNLYAIESNNIDNNMNEFLAKLAQMVGSEFNFGGIIEDENDGSNPEEDDDLGEEANVTYTECNFTDLDVILTARRTSFDKWVILTEQLTNFIKIQDSSDTIKKLETNEAYAELWKDYPNLQEQYLNTDTILDNLQKM